MNRQIGFKYNQGEICFSFELGLMRGTHAHNWNLQ